MATLLAGESLDERRRRLLAVCDPEFGAVVAQT